MRSGSTRGASTAPSAIEPRRIGTPTQANSKYEKAPAPTESAASETMMLTGLPVSTSSEPALPANTIGMSIREAGWAVRRATTTTIGRRAATAPLRLMSAVSTAQRPITATSSRKELSPARATRRPPAHAVMPARSIPSLTTNSVAMNTTTGSPKPAVASSRVSRSVAQSTSTVPSATAPTGSRFQTKRPMTPASTRSATVESLMEGAHYGERRCASSSRS